MTAEAELREGESSRLVSGAVVARHCQVDDKDVPTLYRACVAIATACSAVVLVLGLMLSSLPAFGVYRIELRADARQHTSCNVAHGARVAPPPQHSHAKPWWPDPGRGAAGAGAGYGRAHGEQWLPAARPGLSVLGGAARDNVTGLRGVMIHMPPDGWKLDRMRYRSLPFKPSLWPGVNLTASPQTLGAAEASGLLTAAAPLLRGNIGSALSHIAVWEEVARQKERVLVFEDNVLFKRASPHNVGSLRKSLNYLDAVPAADFINLAPGSPAGTPDGAHAELLRISARRGAASMPRSVLLHGLPKPFNTKNCWLSSYVISPHGARRLLLGFRSARYDLSRTIVDRAVPYHWATDRCASAYVPRVAVFGHAETAADSRKTLNG